MSSNLSRRLLLLPAVACTAWLAGSACGDSESESGRSPGDAGAPCADLAACDGSDVKHASEAEACSGGPCYSRTACDQTIWCARVSGGCGPRPACDEGDLEVASEQACDAGCYSRSGDCNVEIWCQPTSSDAGADAGADGG